MARGRRSTTILEEAGQLAEHMGYRWIPNPHADLAFDFIMFRPTVIAAVKLRKIRNTITGDLDAAKKFPDEVAALRTLPIPLHVNRELWIRTQDDRLWRRFIIFPDMTGEFGHITAENYKNRHVDEDEIRNAPYKVIIPIGKNRGEPVVLELPTGVEEDSGPGSKKASEK